MNIIFERCNQNDLDTLVRISRKTFYDTFHKQNAAENMKIYLDSTYSPEKIHAEIENPLSAFYFVKDRDNNIVGYIKINFSGAQTDIHDVSSLELERIYVVTGYQRLGIGRQMLEKTVDIARQNKLTSVWLGVWEQNTRAIAFYESQGFYKISEHPFILGKDIQTDWILKKDL